MNFLKDRKDHDSKGHSPMKHILHMVLCCGLPILIVFSLPFIARFSPAVAGLLGIIAPFICPIMMGSMMFMMFKGGKHSCCDESKMEPNQTLPKNNG
ncbi:hypothetical protein [Anaerocolumna chitinilytica]|uniref:DUF2933 domain-containing protein n=1 Tax=Anaerocolumna chitinilytica TaxID=1727145 RepID=A0A7I8DIX7_9FIRM|nr:hypothetical protein [Anaerocolumna chitinilytica]BCJ98448.1 hypothetical protein bsdcttw_14890 [Anaerocolumna chitinilytica]